MINENEMVRKAMSMLLHHRCNGLLVVNDSGKLTGVISVQDFAGATVPKQYRDNIFMVSAMYRQVFFAERVVELKDDKVKSVMRRDFVRVTKDTNIMAITTDF